VSRRARTIERGRRALLAAGLLAVLSCHSGTPELREYLLAPAAAANPSPAHDLPALRVRPLAARGFLDRKEIAWRQGSVLAGTYLYHRWCEDPAEMATRALIDALRAAGRFAQVDGAAAVAVAPLTLSGELVGMHEETDADGARPRGVVTVEVTLERRAEGDAPPRHWTRASTATVLAADDSIDALVAAIAAAEEQVVAELAAALAADAQEGSASSAAR
jgi:uncharacterized lipoprotein YmbA